MRFQIFFLVLLSGLSESAHGFGHKKMNFSEVKGVTESQVSKSEDEKKLSVMVRGRGAELLFRTLEVKRAEDFGSPALEILGDVDNSQWTVYGEQISCSRIKATKKKKEDYACSFELDSKGWVAAGKNPFDPAQFNLVKTMTTAKIFPQKKKGRSLASAGPNPSPIKAYAMFDTKDSREEGKRHYEDAMFVFQGPAAASILEFLAKNNSEEKEYGPSGVKGWKGKEISCVTSNGKEQERCALIVSLDKGAISTRKNPLFR